MLFLRLTWVVGQGGLIEGLLVILLCNVVTTVTAISMSAVCTNGQIKGGMYLHLTTICVNVGDRVVCLYETLKNRVLKT